MFSPAPDLLITPTLQLVRSLGEGGMGSVWVAEHLTLRSPVVVKFMAREIADNPEAIARFSREAEVAARARSPHVVQIFDHGVTAEGVPYIVMELLEGMDLGRHLDSVWRMDPGEVATLVSQVASALTRAHRLGVVHRDIKPENVFLTDVDNSDLFVKVLDFGIARGGVELSSRVTRTGVVVGTPQYMSPESLLRPGEVTPAGDLWALAAVAFEALTGQRPFEGDTIAALTLAMHGAKRPRPSALIKGFPEALDAWFDRAFSLDANERFPDARTMAAAFCIAQKETAIRRSTLPPEPKRPVALQRRNVRVHETEAPDTSGLLLSDRGAPTVDAPTLDGPAVAISLRPKEGPGAGRSQPPMARAPSLADGGTDQAENTSKSIGHERPPIRRWPMVLAATVLALLAIVAITAGDRSTSSSAHTAGVSPSVPSPPQTKAESVEATKNESASPLPSTSPTSTTPSATASALPTTSATVLPLAIVAAKASHGPPPATPSIGSTTVPTPIHVPKNFNDVQ